MGVERLFMAINHLNDIRDIPHIKKIYDLGYKNNLSVEYIRVLHSILSDQKKFSFEIGKHRGVYMNRLVREINLSEDDILRILNSNADNQPWYPELKKGIDLTLKYITDYRGNARDTSF